MRSKNREETLQDWKDYVGVLKDEITTLKNRLKKALKLPECVKNLTFSHPVEVRPGDTFNLTFEQDMEDE